LYCPPSYITGGWAVLFPSHNPPIIKIRELWLGRRPDYCRTGGGVAYCALILINGLLAEDHVPHLHAAASDGREAALGGEDQDQRNQRHGHPGSAVVTPQDGEREESDDRCHRERHNDVLDVVAVALQVGEHNECRERVHDSLQPFSKRLNYCRTSSPAEDIGS
jgi:hypothetical protein